MNHPFVKKLRHGARLSTADEQILEQLAGPARSIEAHADIITEGDEPRALPLIVEGWAYRYRILENGKRQILSLFIPGDLCEPFGVLPHFLDYSLGALTPVRFAAVSLGAIRDAAQQSGTIEEALWWDLLVSAALDREHAVSLGRRTATERLAHLFCELHLRMNLVGLADGRGFPMPVIQADLADLLGLSTVHVNRSLQELRSIGLVTLERRWLTIHDLTELKDLSFFDEAPLHLEGSSSFSFAGVAPHADNSRRRETAYDE